MVTPEEPVRRSGGDSGGPVAGPGRGTHHWKGRGAAPDEPGERGTAVVEFSLILPLAMMLILGLFTGAVAYNQKLSLTHAAREGARYAATVHQNQRFGTGNCAVDTDACWDANMRKVIVERANGELTGAGVEICVALVHNDGAGVLRAVDDAHTTQADGASPCFPDDSGDTGKRVQVLVKRPGKINALVFVTNVTLTSKAQAHYEST